MSESESEVREKRYPRYAESDRRAQYIVTRKGARPQVIRNDGSVVASMDFKTEEELFAAEYIKEIFTHPAPVSDVPKCEACNGTGSVERTPVISNWSEHGDREQEACGECDGTGTPSPWQPFDGSFREGVDGKAMQLLREVYRQAGNHAPANRRHALTPGLRDEIRDLIYAQRPAPASEGNCPELPDSSTAAPSPAVAEVERGPMLVEGKTPWQFACDWYDEASIVRAVQDRQDPLPFCTTNDEAFGKWLTNQYRLAMNKGMDIALRSRAADFDALTKECDEYVESCKHWRERCEAAEREVERLKEECANAKEAIELFEAMKEGATVRINDLTDELAAAREELEKADQSLARTKCRVADLCFELRQGLAARSDARTNSAIAAIEVEVTGRSAALAPAAGVRG